MVRPAHLITLPLVLALAAGTCLAQDKPADQPNDAEAARKREFLEKLEELKKATAPKADPPATTPAPAQPQPAPAVNPAATVPTTPAANQPAGDQPAGPPNPAPKPVVAPSEPGADAKSIDSPVAPDMVRLGPFTDEVDIKLLVKLVQEELKIQIISTDQALRDKKVSLMPNAIEIKRSELLPFLQLLLEQNGQILTRDVGNIWIIKAQTDLNGGNPGADSSTTQIISTLGLKPTSLQNAIQAAMRAGGGQPAAGPLAYLDDLGVIVMTDTPRRISAIRALIATIAAEQQNAEIVRFDLKYIAAPVARVRLLELAGQFTRALAPGASNDPGAQALNQATAQPGANASPNTSNLAQRLIVNPQGNGLLFRGRPDERAFVEKLIPIVDMPNDLVPRYYDIPAAIIIAEQGSRQGLGELKIMRSLREGISAPGTAGTTGQPGSGQAFGVASAITEVGGPSFIVDPEGRGFMYYGTPEQQERLGLIVQQFRDAVKRDDVVYEFYKLKHASAPDTAEIIRGLIANQAVGGSSSLLPGNRGSTAQTRRANQPAAAANPATPNRPTTSASTNELGEIVASDDIFVQADERNNQLIVKAPRRLQPQFAKLIEKLDLRRAQVYIDCKIVVVTDTADSRIAVETQLINANATGGALRTLFPPSAMPIGTTGNITQIPVIVPAVGATAAIIKTGSVAATIIAIANTTDARIVASPQLLVDDNEEAEVVSLEQRPTTTTTQSSGAGSTQTAFGGYEDAGPKLKVKPRISTSNSLSINYEIELSSFQPDAADASSGVPPPKQKNNIKSDSVTLPSDSTLVVGGLAFEQKGKTVIKVPYLGDIPVVGQLFRDERTSNNKRTFYVFITPRVMRDQGFDDLRLNTEGPASAVRILDPLPPPVPSVIPISPMPQPLRTPPGDQNGWNGPNLGYPEPSAPAPSSTPRTPGTSEPS